MRKKSIREQNKGPHPEAFLLDQKHSQSSWSLCGAVSGQSLLYPGCGVGVRQGVVVASGGEGVEGMKRLHAGDGTGDHGNGVGRHQRHVVWGTA